MRIASLKKDGNDDNAFRGGRQKHVGTYFNEFYQPIPFFFTRDRMPLHLIGQYRGRSIFFICNGPSLASGNYDLSLLKNPGVMTYGINNGAKTIRPNFWSCVDDPKRFLKSIWLDPSITKIVPHAHQNKPLFDNETWKDMVDANGRPMVVGDCPNVVYFHRNEKFNAERFLYEDTINWGNSGGNGGGRTVMLPALRAMFLLGFRRVYLLGADFNMSESNTYHFDEQRSKGAVNCNMSTYNTMQHEYFPQLKPYFDAEGFEVYNCNPDSKLTIFPYVSYENAILDATSGLGDVINERSWGMYGKVDEKGKFGQEPPPECKKHLKNIKIKPLVAQSQINITAEQPNFTDNCQNNASNEDIFTPEVVENQDEVENCNGKNEEDIGKNEIEYSLKDRRFYVSNNQDGNIIPHIPCIIQDTPMQNVPVVKSMQTPTTVSNFIPKTLFPKTMEQNIEHPMAKFMSKPISQPMSIQPPVRQQQDPCPPTVNTRVSVKDFAVPYDKIQNTQHNSKPQPPPIPSLMPKINVLKNNDNAQKITTEKSTNHVCGYANKIIRPVPCGNIASKPVDSSDDNRVANPKRIGDRVPNIVIKQITLEDE